MEEQKKQARSESRNPKYAKHFAITAANKARRIEKEKRKHERAVARKKGA